MKKTTGITKFYMGAILLLPVLAQYSVIGGSLDLDVIVMVALLIGFLFRKSRLQVNHARISTALIAYVVVVTAANLLWGQKFASPSAIIMRAGRYCLYLLIVLFVAMDEVDYKTIMKIYRVIAYLALGYILLQTVVYYGTGIILPNRIGIRMGDANYGTDRLAAFYSEPADMAYSVIPFVVCSLFGPRYMEKDRRFIDSICITGAVILTTSSQGCVAVILLWLGWFVFKAVRRELTLKIFLLFLAAIVMAMILYSTGILAFALDRLQDGQDSTAWEARSGGYVALKLLSPVQKWFGAGYGNYITENKYGLDTYGLFINYSSLAENLFTLGYLGTALLAAFLWLAFRKGKPYQKVLVAMMVFLSIGGCPFTGKYMPLYFSLMLCRGFEDFSVGQAEAGLTENHEEEG